MKRIFLLLAIFLPISLKAEQVKTVYSPFTGKPDYITVLTSTTISNNFPDPLVISTLTVTLVLISSGTAGNVGQVLTSQGNGTPPIWSNSAGTNPAGSDGQIQYNKSGVFGAESQLTFDTTNFFMGIGTGTLNDSLTMVSTRLGEPSIVIFPMNSTPSSPIGVFDVRPYNGSTNPTTKYFTGVRTYTAGSNPPGMIWGPNATTENMKFETSGILHILDSTGTANLNILGNALIGTGAIGQTAPTDGLLVSGETVLESSTCYSSQNTWLITITTDVTNSTAQEMVFQITPISSPGGGGFSFKFNNVTPLQIRQTYTQAAFGAPLRLGDTSNSHFIGIKSSASLAGGNADFDFVFVPKDGNNGQSIITDGSHNLSIGNIISSVVNASTGTTIPSAGILGENVSSVTFAATNLPATTNYGDLLSVPLSSGAWLVTIRECEQANGATITSGGFIGISTNTGNSNANLTEGTNQIQLPLAATTDGCGSIPSYLMTFNSTTTVYAKMEDAYTLGQPKMVGSISAIRPY